jgi:hypothetical protein
MSKMVKDVKYARFERSAMLRIPFTTCLVLWFVLVGGLPLPKVLKKHN